MELVPGTTRLTTDGVVGTSGQPVRVFSIELISGASAGSVVLVNGTTNNTSTAYAQVDGVASQSVLYNYSGGKRFPSGCFLTTLSNINYCTIVAAQEF